MFFPKPCFFSKHIHVNSSISHHMNPLSLWNHGVLEKVKNSFLNSGDENRPDSWKLIFLPISSNSNLFLRCVSLYSDHNIIWVLSHDSHKKLTISWASACFLCCRMMNKNNWSNKFFSGNKGSPGKGKAPLRSPGSANTQDTIASVLKKGSKRKTRKERRGKSWPGCQRMNLWAPLILARKMELSTLMMAY